MRCEAEKRQKLVRTRQDELYLRLVGQTLPGIENPSSCGVSAGDIHDMMGLVDDQILGLPQFKRPLKGLSQCGFRCLVNELIKLQSPLIFGSGNPINWMVDRLQARNHEVLGGELAILR